MTRSSGFSVTQFMTDAGLRRLEAACDEIIGRLRRMAGRKQIASQELSGRLRNLVRKWLAQAHHPQRANKGEEREILTRCAGQLHAEPDK